MPDLGDTDQRVPPHLQRFVVQQDYAAYTAVDHAVWRFVLLQMYHRLELAAHPAYARGFGRSGMSVERIPRIAEMDACLADLGWGAVCVDGFIPPRAFQEFQALGILPIAAEIRTVEHLPYTPAPDIIHEAAGHAPLLPDPEYAAFLRRIGECGMRAFASRHDADVYDAIHRLSVVKEQRDAGANEVATAEGALAALCAQPVLPSEAARLARLYWWTVEYGLVGTPHDYKLYGAGLLSSLGESHFCHRPEVHKVSLSRDCVEVDYDITQPQPQLFVARDLAQLSEVLDQVCASMAFRVGGLTGLQAALAAEEVATFELDSGLWVTGKVTEVIAGEAGAQLVVVQGRHAIGEHGRTLEGCGSVVDCKSLAVALDPLAGGGELRQLSPEMFARRVGAEGERARIELASGLVAEGRLEHTHARLGDGVRVVTLRDARVSRGARAVWEDPAGRMALLAGRSVTSVRAGAKDAAFWPAADHPQLNAPARRPEGTRQRSLRLLYERGARAGARTGRAAQRGLAAVHGVLRRDHPKEWLLRWNVLESLGKRDLDEARRGSLVSELWRLEHELDGRYPIAMGLRYLGYDEEGK